MLLLDSGVIMDKELRIAFQTKEKLEIFLANLEKLRHDNSVTNSAYTTLKNEYTGNLNKSLTRIGQLKQAAEKKLQIRKRELEVYKHELSNLEARFKVGQISADSLMRASKTPEKKMSYLENIVGYLNSLINTVHSSEITVREESGLASFLSLIGRAPGPESNKTHSLVPVMQDSPLPTTPEVAILDTTIISNLHILPDRIRPGGTVGIIATIINTAQETVHHRAEFRVNQKLESVNDMMLEAGQSSELTFMTVAVAPGDYTVSVDAASGFFKVI